MPAEQRNHLEDVQEPTQASADVIKGQIQRGEYQNAYTACQKTELSDAEYEDFSKSIDAATLPENKNKKETCSAEEYEKIQQENLNKNIDDFAIEHDPDMRIVNDTQELLAENEEIIDELLAEISKAKTSFDKSRGSQQWTLNVVPIIGSIYGLFKGKKILKHLDKIEALQQRLNNGKLLSSPNLDADKITPAKGQGFKLGGTAAAAGGFLIAGPLGMIPGIITNIYGGFNTFENYEASGKGIEDLEKLEQQLLALKGQDNMGLETCEEAQSAYRKGANKNLENLAVA